MKTTDIKKGMIVSYGPHDGNTPNIYMVLRPVTNEDTLIHNGFNELNVHAGYLTKLRMPKRQYNCFISPALDMPKQETGKEPFTGNVIDKTFENFNELTTFLKKMHAKFTNMEVFINKN